jgi:hypothetical protein
MLALLARFGFVGFCVALPPRGARGVNLGAGFF